MGWEIRAQLQFADLEADFGNGVQSGMDVGYGRGWMLMAGSIVHAADHLIFRDATGAEYRLDGYSHGIDTWHQGIYVSFDSLGGRLFFPDGSFWAMSSYSASGEADAGNMYPT